MGGLQIPLLTGQEGHMHRWPLWPLGASSDKALNPDTGRSTLCGSVGLSGQTQGLLAEGGSTQVLRGCASLFPGGMLGRATVLSGKGLASQQHHM